MAINVVDHTTKQQAENAQFVKDNRGQLARSNPRRSPWRVVIWFRTIRIVCFRATRFALAVFFRTLWVRNITNGMYLPTKGPAIVVANHTSHADWVILASLIGPRAFFLAADEVRRELLVKLLEPFNFTIYLDREQPGVGYYREILRLLQSKKIAVIFPEGTRSRTGRRTPSKPGFVKLALKSRAPIIPVAIVGAHRVWPPNVFLPRPRRCDVIIGRPILVLPTTPMFSNLMWKGDGRPQGSVLEEMAERVMDTIGDMAGPSWDNPNLRRRHQFDEGTVSLRRYGETVSAFFDLDRTIVPFYTQQKFATYCVKRKIITPTDFYKIGWFFLANRFGLIGDNVNVRERLYAIFSKKTVGEWREILKDFCSTIVKPAINRTVQDIIQYHRRHRHRVVLVSASAEPIVTEVGQQLGVGDVIATKLSVSESHYTGKIEGDIVDGFRKAIAVDSFSRKNGINLSASYAYGDSFSDIRFLKRVGVPTAVNPSKKMTAFARRNSWPVLRT